MGKTTCIKRKLNRGQTGPDNKRTSWGCRGKRNWQKEMEHGEKHLRLQRIREEETDGESEKGKRGRPGFSSLSLLEYSWFGFYRIEKKERERLQCGAAVSPNSRDIQTGGCLYTWGPVLNAGRVVQSPRS